MKLGAFSISLAVKDLQISKTFYEKFGFEAFGGDAAQGWLIMKNGAHAIGLFQGMFEKNMLTFNPGWDEDCETLTSFTDVRDLQAGLECNRQKGQQINILVRRGAHGLRLFSSGKRWIMQNAQ